MAGESLRSCLHCGSQIPGFSRAKFCSFPCRQSTRVTWNKGLKGIKANRPRNGLNQICKQCGKEFYLSLSMTRRIYCSKECYYQSRWKEKQKEKRECIVCHSVFETYKSTQRKYCSHDCYSKHRSEVFIGSSHPLWKGGSTNYRGPNWKSQRSVARDRDNHTCQRCGITRKTLRKELDVHHIVPFRNFEDYRKANELINLITLCPSCHHQVEFET